MDKYAYINNELTATPYSHANYIKQEDYDVAVRLIILDKEKIIYIRINEFDSLYQGLEYKKVEYKFKQNLKACEAYLERNYRKYRIYNSYNINELQYQLQKDILNS
jgi:hypothetical protein